MREALGRGIPVITSNKWPIALHGVELAELAANQGVALRAESTVMSGTPLLGPLTEGLGRGGPDRAARHRERDRELHRLRHGVGTVL